MSKQSEKPLKSEFRIEDCFRWLYSRVDNLECWASTPPRDRRPLSATVGTSRFVGGKISEMAVTSDWHALVERVASAYQWGLPWRKETEWSESVWEMSYERCTAIAGRIGGYVGVAHHEGIEVPGTEARYHGFFYGPDVPVTCEDSHGHQTRDIAARYALKRLATALGRYDLYSHSAAIRLSD